MILDNKSGGFVQPSERLHCISRTVQWIHVICGTYVAYGSLMCHFVFGDYVMHINEWAGLNVKIGNAHILRTV